MGKNGKELKYEELDPKIRRAVQLLNKFYFCETVTSCEGHVEYIGHDTYGANYWIDFAVNDETAFKKFISDIAPEFQQITSLSLNLSRHFEFTKKGMREGTWHICFYMSSLDFKEIEKTMKKARMCFERITLEYQYKHPETLE
jgi:hypothetical protein